MGRQTACRLFGRDTSRALADYVCRTLALYPEKDSQPASSAQPGSSKKLIVTRSAGQVFDGPALRRAGLNTCLYSPGRVSNKH